MAISALFKMAIKLGKSVKQAGNPGRAVRQGEKIRKSTPTGEMATKAIKPTPKSGKMAKPKAKPKIKVKAGTVAGAAIGGSSMGYAKYNSDKMQKKRKLLKENKK